MSRDAQNRAKAANDQAMSLSKDYGQKASSLYGQLVPMYTQQATNPTGLSQDTKNNMTTASMQSTGGSVAGAVGQGYLDAARTGNAGGYQTALRDAARQGIATNSKNALDIENKDAALKEVQRQQGISGLQGLQSESQSGAISALNPAVGAVNAQSEAGTSGWLQNTLGIIAALNGTASSAADLGFGKK